MQNYKLIPGINWVGGTCAYNQLIPTKPIKVQRGQERTHVIFHRSLCLALDNRRWADLTGARGRGRALGRGRTLDLGTARTRAGWAFSLGLITLRAIQEHGLRPGDRRLQNIVAQIRNRRNFTLQNVVAQIRTGGTRGNRRLQNIPRQVWFSARGARGPGHRATAGHRLLTRTALG
jgi:hypothetical protein